ncbi:mitochondrial distribution and morphology protein family 31/32 [Fimicolochytrium jonesii]|uniref:mitochondrial distribution and morphology protein family 31/32 n=1 Tax=Fimicolochytrium jonesii TaxID=1396493 RepID=UPI0022FE09A5|nr:mitochondrial distribution and morphology protein family 31/32 [Fimicolochytrium jonesii]KAI8816063.1 mitochondrial distribution and morphology protein family 31/32 [Fimicolochytrium jonesii]
MRNWTTKFMRMRRPHATKTSSGQPHQQIPPLPPHSAPSWRVARALLLDNVSGFWPRLRLRIKLFLMGGQRPWRADDVFALFSWIFMGHTVFLLVGTTTFLSILLGVANSLQFQAYLAKAISDYVTEETGMKVNFESAIVPRWKEGAIRLDNVSIVCNDKTWRELKNSERERRGLPPLDDEELDVNWTYWDITCRHIDISLSFWRWLDGKGLIKECSIKGVRGEIDRRHVEWPADWIPKRREPQSGDFEMTRFVIEDLLVTIRNKKFRPYSVSIFNAELPQLRKHWLLYDIMRADVMNGMFDNCLFSVHKLQRPDMLLADGENDSQWEKMSHLKLNGLPIDHMNAGVEGPLGWITRGTLDIDLQLFFPQSDGETFLAIIRDELEDLTDAALDKIEEVITSHPETEDRHQSIIARHYHSKHGGAKSEPADAAIAKADRAMVMMWNVRLNDLKASVPLVSPHISYINSALIRPIVGYLNAVNTSINIRFGARMDLSNFEGAWTIYQAGLTDVLGEETGRAITTMVAQQRAKHLKRVATWSLQSVTRNLTALVEYAKGIRGWKEWSEARMGGLQSGNWLAM